MSAVSDLESEERELVFDSFDAEAAWQLGSRIVAIARRAGHPVAVDIRRPGQQLFHAVLPGAAPDQGIWAARKAAVVLRMEQPSARVAARFGAWGIGSGWLASDEYAVTGGSFPIRVRGTGVVAAATVSGLASQEDHDLVVGAIRDAREEAA